MKENFLAPTGPYKIETSKIDLYDENRPEINYPDGRLIPCQWYFPIDTLKDHKVYEKELEARGLKKFPALESICFSKPSDLKSICDGKFPLVILNHGHCVSMTDYTFITEELASYGYVVVSICHQLDSDQDTPEFLSGRSCSKHASIIDNILYVFNWISVQIENIFHNKLDTGKIALIGHSMGGNALLMLANRVSCGFRKTNEHLFPHFQADNSIKECIIFMDGEFPPIYSKNIPVFYMLSDERKDYQKTTGVINYLLNNQCYFKHYNGSKHISFMDHGLVYSNTPHQKGIYFNGTHEELIEFYKDVRKDIREFLSTHMLK